MQSFSESEIATVIRRILIADVYLDVEAADIESTSSLRDDIGLDSLGFIELRSQCERRFDVTISDDDFNPANFHSVETLVTFLARVLGQSRSTAQRA